MSFCADLEEPDTKNIAFKLIFSIIMTVLSLAVFPQASLSNPYEVFVPPNYSSSVSVYLVVDSYAEANEDLSDIKLNGIDGVIVMPDLTQINTSVLKNITSRAKELDLSVSLSLGGTILSNESYMSDGYKDDFRAIISELINKSVLDDLKSLELLPYINAPSEYGTTSDDPLEALFGSSRDDVTFLGDLIELLVNESTVIRTTLHISYYRSFRVILGWLGEISGLDQIGIAVFQSHLNAVPTALSNGISHTRRITDKEVVIGQIGYSTHDDIHNRGMQDAWFWACVDVASSFDIAEVGVWQWKDRVEFPFIVEEIIEAKYGIKDKPIMYSIENYNREEGINYIGYSTNIIEVFLGSFSTSGSTGVISGNIVFSILIRIMIGILIGRKCKLNGRFLGFIIFGLVLIFHFSMGVVIINSPHWWIVLFTYLYLFGSITAGVYQIQIVSTIVRHKKVFDFCDMSDAHKCTLDFLQE